MQLLVPRKHVVFAYYLDENALALVRPTLVTPRRLGVGVTVTGMPVTQAITFANSGRVVNRVKRKFWLMPLATDARERFAQGDLWWCEHEGSIAAYIDSKLERRLFREARAAARMMVADTAA